MLSVFFAFVVVLGVAACGGGGETTTVTETVSESPAPEGEDADGPISREEAERIAVDAAGGGQATWIGREDERGAVWEVEVTRPDGSEVDVLLAADGAIVKQVPKLSADEADDDGSADDGGGGGGGGVVSRQQAERAALAAVGEGRVSWSGREDDRGAAWEVEVTRPDGSEVDVLIAADGSVVD